MNPDGTWAEVVAVVEQPATLDAWNLTVEVAHSYFVAETQSASPVWVHNKCSLFEAYNSFERARNRGLDLASGIDPATRTATVGKFGDMKGKITGFRGKTADGTPIQFRLDWDKDIGPHFNVMNGRGDSAVNYHLTFPGGQEDVLSYLKQFQ